MNIPAAAQAPRFSVSGQVLDGTGLAVVGATVTLRRPAAAFERTTLTNGAGRYEFAGVPDGTYTVSATLAGFSVAERPVTVWRQAVTLDLTLQPGVFAEEISVVGARLVGSEEMLRRIPGSVDVLTSDNLWGLRELPQRLVVLGGGPVGCELAQAFARLGSQVTQLEVLPRLLAREDEDVSAFARAALEADGVAVLTGHTALRCESGDDGKFIVVGSGGVERRIGFDALLCAVGRSARLAGFGLEELGIPVQRTVQVNDHLETKFPNILAAGDVAGPYQFTHTAAHQAWYAAVNALFGSLRKFKADYTVIPRATFIDPEVARVGLNEQEAREQKITFEVTRYGIDDLDRAIADSAAHGWVKVLTVPGQDRILGVTIVGVHAGDLLAEYVLAMKHGLGLNKILGTIHTYPTLAEANKYAAGQWKRAHQPARLLEWVAKFHTWRRA